MNRVIFLTLLRKEIRELFRTYRFTIGLMVFVVLAVLAPIGARFLPQLLSTVGRTQGIQIDLPRTSVVDALVQYVRNMTQISGVVIILLSMGSISIETDGGTAAFLFVKPVPRSVFVLAKLSAMWLLLLVLLIVSAAISGSTTLLLFGRFHVMAFAEMNGLLFLYLAVIVALSVMASSVFTSQAAASVSAAAIWVGLVLLVRVGRIGAYSPEGLVVNATGLAQLHARFVAEFESFRPFIGSGAVIVIAIVLAVIAIRRWEP